ncbi:DEAD/DEAH box helicase family protein [Actinokineospora globicatena]|uniref:DEAD/DEAH box helicase family protein n=1 Tax=Actinokineospora globicatena TaxID=103729 RepID=UPI0020A5B9AD|nr:DEAD/DEAH box helicase family protein [Actinokineospora globicatena]MCP2302406.1 type I restriction enzyme, R subunit [Actinokineospora globicatena]GLW75918.1 restriction endonuclease subunit R [Actinokineospora globicatena]GLW82758.1 restriction endonuclease subunit R [Actinokineospora globicatena]
MSNFGFLEAEWPDLCVEARNAERLAIGDPRASCFYARRTLELALTWLYDAEGSLRHPYKHDLSAMIAEPTLIALVGPGLRMKMDVIRREGNIAVHRRTPVAANDAVRVVTELFHVLYWVARTYSRNPTNLPEPGIAFNQAVIPRPLLPSMCLAKQAELREQEKKYADQDAALAAERKKNENLDAELAELQAQIKAAKAANETRPDTHDYKEAETRTNIIDLLLKEAGWALDQPQDREYPVTGLPASAAPSGKGKVDYVLWDDDGKPLAVVEAKATSRTAEQGKHKAKLYADCLEKEFGQRPIIFYTNGYQTYLWDDLNYPQREVQGFYTKDELRLLIQRRVSRLTLAKLPINEQIAGRDYQSQAIRRIAEDFENKSQRHALLVMATGSGKTRTVIALTDLMMRANWAKRILFLADRKALVTQAVNAFKQHLPGTTTVNLVTEKDLNARVFVSTYPTLMNMINEVDGSGLRRFGPGCFDMIVIDEAHRSIYQKYSAIFEYFDALLVGLTATPKDEIDRNTYRRFQLEDGVPTDVYTLDEAVSQGYLVAPRAVDVPLKFQRDGIRYADLSEEEKEYWDQQEWDEDGNVPDEITVPELNKYLFNKDTVDKALQTLMTHGLKVAARDRLGKTIIFAANNKHAEFIAERFDVNYPEYKSEFAQVITYRKDYAQSLIDQFSDPAKAPHIAISVDMLDTGIDVPEVVNLVFFKLVRSKTKFWQMIGRGTRLAPNLFGPNRDKTGFLVFDLCQNVEFFNQDLMPAEGRLAPSLGQRLFERRADLLLALGEHYPDQIPAARKDANGTTSEPGLRWDLAQRLHDEVTGMNPENFLVRPHRQQIDTFSDFDNWLKLTPEAHAEVVDHLAGLPTAHRDNDDNSEEAKRFDLLALRLQLALIHVEPGYARLQAQVQEIVSALLDQLTIPAVRAQQELLGELADDHWWQDVTLPMLENMRRRVRGLVKLIEKTKRNIVYTDFEDRLGDLTAASLNGMALGADLSRFEQKLRIYLRTHENQLAVQKIRRNRQITATDLADLERIFIESGIGTEVEIEQAKSEAGGLGIFLRSLTGLDRAAAAAAFGKFQAGKTLTSVQLRFVNELIDYLAHNGTITVDVLYLSPFNAIAPGGPEDLFLEVDIEAMTTVMHSINATAVPA